MIRCRVTADRSDTWDTMPTLVWFRQDLQPADFGAHALAGVPDVGKVCALETKNDRRLRLMMGQLAVNRGFTA
jgi:hypothetical protein